MKRHLNSLFLFIMNDEKYDFLEFNLAFQEIENRKHEVMDLITKKLASKNLLLKDINRNSDDNLKTILHLSASCFKIISNVATSLSEKNKILNKLDSIEQQILNIEL